MKIKSVFVQVSINMLAKLLEELQEAIFIDGHTFETHVIQQIVRVGPNVCVCRSPQLIAIITKWRSIYLSTHIYTGKKVWKKRSNIYTPLRSRNSYVTTGRETSDLGPRAASRH